MKDSFNIGWNVEQFQNKAWKSTQNLDKSINFTEFNTTILNELKEDIKKSNRFLAWFSGLLSWIIWWVISWIIVYLITSK